MSAAATAAHCPYCRQPLGTLQQSLGTHCGAAACRHRAAQARAARLEQTLGEPARQAALDRLDGRPVTLLWLRTAPIGQAPPSKATRAAHRDFLMRLIEAPAAAGLEPLAPAPNTLPLGPQEWRLCAQCHGRCCALGGPNHAFITLPQLLRWQQREPGRTLQDAVDWYMAQIAERHPRGACVYQGKQGCVLPREDRADICNSYACEPLQQMQQHLRADPQAAFVAVTLDGDNMERRALITAAGLRRI